MMSIDNLLDPEDQIENLLHRFDRLKGIRERQETLTSLAALPLNINQMVLLLEVVKNKREYMVETQALVSKLMERLVSERGWTKIQAMEFLDKMKI